MSEPKPNVFDQKCQDCLHWSQYESKQMRGLGECRRFPPTLAVRRSQMPDEDNPCMGVFPEIRADGWCGEWKQSPNPDE